MYPNIRVYLFKLLFIYKRRVEKRSNVRIVVKFTQRFLAFNNKAKNLDIKGNRN